MARPRKPYAALGYECGPRHAPAPPPSEVARPRRPSEVLRRLPPLTDDQAAALKALSADCVYATVGGGCAVVRVDPKREIETRALKELEALGLVEVVELHVYQKRGN